MGLSVSCEILLWYSCELFLIFRLLGRHHFEAERKIVNLYREEIALLSVNLLPQDVFRIKTGPGKTLRRKTIESYRLM